MSDQHRSGCGFLQTKTGFALLVLGGIAALFLILEHQAHLWNWLPFLFLLACPLMHLFMHGGRGHSHGGPREGAPQAEPPADRDHRRRDEERDRA